MLNQRLGRRSLQNGQTRFSLPAGRRCCLSCSIGDPRASDWSISMVAESQEFVRGGRSGSARHEAQAVSQPASGSSEATTSRPSVPDIRATWAAKLVVSDADQADAQKLGERYEQMARDFEIQGVNVAAITAQRQYYGGLQPGQTAYPLQYKDFPTPLELGAVRLAIFLLADAQALQLQVLQATEDIMHALPQDMRPCAAWRQLASECPPPQFKVHSILFASSGTLLLCFVDLSGRLLEIRRRARSSFPGACEKQSSIMHMTLGRVLTGRAMTSEEVHSVRAKCKHWTSRLQGNVFAPTQLWHCQEYTFTTVEGKREALRLQATEGLS
ncbi:hypothetical protein WJX73_009426 [Symbiochloris irregularis]|uniref:Uncharacterized protein n=1 Tax=Symbiochloris irregularis TaxID=706552 RepID=A0AAW1NUH6_9CHLO